MVKKVWAKFNEMDLVCVCDEHHRKCQKDDDCKEYVAKFIEVNRNEELEETLKNFDKDLTGSIKRFESEISKSIRKLKYKI